MLGVASFDRAWPTDVAKAVPGLKLAQFYSLPPQQCVEGGARS